MAFSDFKEQAQTVRLLQRSLERGRLGHAYLFSGDDLGELERIAASLAKTLNCSEPVLAGEAAVDACDRCASCRKIDESKHADIRWIRPESKSRIITIDQMRAVMHSVNLKPTEARFKVAIIVGAERMNVQAANSFLKTLEEPPVRSILVLLSTDPQQLLDTIVSRCLRMNFSRGSVRLDEKQMAWIREFSDMAATRKGGVFGRYRLLGTLLRRLKEDRAEIEELLASRSPLEEYSDADPKLRERWEDELTAAVEAEYRRRRSELLAGLQWWLRDVWLRTHSASEDLFMFPDLADRIGDVARHLSPGQATENLDVIERTQRLLNTNVQEALALEVGLLKLHV